MLSSHSALTPEEMDNLIMNVLKRTTNWVSARKADILETMPPKKMRQKMSTVKMKRTTRVITACADVFVGSISPARMMMKQITVLTTT